MSRRKPATASTIVCYEPSSDTSAAEALLAAAEVEIGAAVRTSRRMPTDSGMLSYALSNLHNAREALELRRTFRKPETGP